MTHAAYGLTLALKSAPALLAMLLCGAALAQTAPPTPPTPPDVFLLKTYDGSQDVSGWVMSEKLDGMRGLWDGQRLRSRGGHALHAPDWFTRRFPPFALDGELWSKRGDFENIVSIARQKTPHRGWAQLRYHVFEVPGQAGGLLQRLAVLHDYLRQNPAEHLVVIAQTRIRSAAHLAEFLAEVTAGGGEGVVVRNPATPYQTGRLPSALKVKNYQDAECAVRKILPGKGKYRGQMGAVQCQMADGRMVNIGSGFTDQNRANPPPLGRLITFKYYGLTKKGKPRFPVYLRLRR